MKQNDERNGEGNEKQNEKRNEEQNEKRNEEWNKERIGEEQDEVQVFTCSASIQNPARIQRILQPLVLGKVTVVETNLEIQLPRWGQEVLNF